MSEAGAPTYPVATIARLLLLTERRVQQLVKEGVIPKTERNRYELAPAVQGYIRYLQERMAGNTAAPADMHLEKSRLVKLQADKAQIELDHLNEVLVKTEDVAKEWENILTDMKSKVLSIPSKAAPLLSGQTEIHVIMDMLQKFVEEALLELSDYGKPVQSEEDLIEWDENPAPTTKANG